MISVSDKELKENYNSVSAMCHTMKQPVIVRSGGIDDLVLMPHEMYLELTSMRESELRRAIDELDDRRE